MLSRAGRLTIVTAALVLAACATDDTAEESPQTTEQPEPDDGAADPDADPTEDAGAVEDAPDEPAEQPDADDADPSEVVASGGYGVLAGEADGSVDDAVAAIEDVLADAPANVAVEVDHAAGARDAGLELPDTRLLVFGDPEVGTPLMQQEPLMGLDLPAKLLVWDRDGTTLAGVNDTAFLALRHGLDPALDDLAALDEAQRNLLGAAGAGNLPERLDPGGVPTGIEVVDSDAGFDETLARARAAIDGAAPELIAEIDHAAAADGVGLDLPPATLLVFGNPEAGTPLMQSGRSVGIDLPQKLLIYDDDGQIRIAYNDPAYLGTRHLLSGVDEPLSAIDEALAGLAAAAAG